MSYHRSVDSVNQAKMVLLIGNGTTYEISYLDPNTIYMVYVFATNSAGNSDFTTGVLGMTGFGGERLLIHARVMVFHCSDPYPGGCSTEPSF